MPAQATIPCPKFRLPMLRIPRCELPFDAAILLAAEPLNLCDVRIRASELEVMQFSVHEIASSSMGGATSPGWPDTALDSRIDWIAPNIKYDQTLPSMPRNTMPRNIVIPSMIHERPIARLRPGSRSVRFCTNAQDMPQHCARARAWGRGEEGICATAPLPRPSSISADSGLSSHRRCPLRSASTPKWRVSKAQRLPNALYRAHRGRLIEVRLCFQGSHYAEAMGCIELELYWQHGTVDAPI